MLSQISRMKGSFHHVCILSAMFGILVHETRGCTNVVPGLDRMTRGIDITTFDLYDKDNRGLRQAIVEFTCGRGKNKTIDGTLYAIPDEVNSVTAVPGGISNAVTTVVRTYNESRDALAQNFQIGGTVKKFGFSLSQSLRQTQEAIYKESRYVSTVSAFESAREAQLQTVYDLEISPNAKRYMENYLVADRKPDNEDFSRFIRDYGTHYFQAANFGGILLVELQTKTSYYREHGEEALKVQAKANYLNVVKTSGGVEVVEEVVDEEFTKLTTTSTRYYGGTADLLDPNGFKRWQPTVSKKPWLFSGKLVPIYGLFKDTIMRHKMESAVNDHVLRTHLDELIRLILNRQSAWTNGQEKLRALKARVDTMKETSWLGDVESEVQTLSQDVLGQISVPRWFIDRTTSCYSWYNDGKGQCSGPTSRVCASPSMMLPKDQDSAPSICPIAGSLTLRNHDDWFNRKQLCFRWSKCDAGWIKEFCKSVNELTTSFILDLGTRGSTGCHVSWKIQATDSMPLWEQNTQLCFVWRPDQPRGQCGPELCAQTGNWTEFYPSRMKLLERCGATSGGVSRVWNALLKLTPWFLVLYSLIGF